MNKKLIRYLSVMLLLIAASGFILAKGSEEKKNSLKKTLGEPVYTKFNINNISTWVKNDGETDINQNGNSGLVFPKGSNRTAIFQSGFLWGGKVDGQIRVGGSVYRQGTVPGYIKADFTAAPSSDADVRIYRVRRDYKEGDLSSELADGDGASIDAIRAQYAKDWNEWPAKYGAPYEDVNGNGSYEPTIDVPGVPGADQTIWFVANDLDAAQTDFMYGSLPMGIEEQVTVWGYNTTGALGNMLFRKFTIINKNKDKKAFTDMYVSMWSDPDLGNAGDDFVGCDTTLSLGYVYNANAVDQTYDPLPPPAAGFDFFQGPVVEGEALDVAHFKDHLITGKKNLPMTSFYFFINGDAVYTDPTQGNYDKGTLGFYNLFQGKVSTTGQFFTDPLTNQPTTFALAGDPVTRIGWIDGLLHAPADRRLGMASGPFNMAFGDTQEIVVAEICAGAITGVDRLGAVGLLKFYDLQAQLAYDNFFNVPTAPPAPLVTAVPLNKEIVLYWGNDATKVAATESYEKGGFAFQGYNVYQLPSATAQKADAKLIATYDLNDGIAKIIDQEFDATAGVVQNKVVIFGSDSGIKRDISIKVDAINGGSPLYNGSKYYLAVTSYAYNPDPNAVPRVLENPIAIMTVIPQTEVPGTSYAGKNGDVISSTQTVGSSDGIVEALVVDPSKTTGDNYKVTFTEVTDADHNTTLTWNLVDVTKTKTVLATQTQVGDLSGPIVDGLRMTVISPPVEINNWAFSGGTRWFTGVNWGGLQMGGGLDVGINFWGSSLAADQYRTVEIRFKSTPTGQKAYRYVRGATPNYAYQDYAQQYFTVWDVTSSPAKQLAVAYVEQNGVAAANSLWQPTYANSDREYLFIMNDAYTDQPDAKYTAKRIYYDAATLPIMYAWWPLLRSASYTFNPQDGQILKITPNFAIAPNHVFTFTAPSVTVSDDLAKQDVEKINVFPNPYYGVNPQELNKYQRFVTISHLPTKATIRIFNLAGQLVRTYLKDNVDQFQRWDLNNEESLPVASGLYIVHIDMPDLGKTKILKVAIIQEQQVLDRF